MGLFGYTVYYRSIYLHVHLMVVEYVLNNKPQFDPREVLSKLALRYLLRLMRRCHVLVFVSLSHLGDNAQ